MNASRFRCCALVFRALLALAAGAAHVWAQDATQDKPIELPAYNVTETRDLPKPERWSYARIPGFEVLSSTSDRATQRLVRDFARFHVALGLVWPGVQQASATPAALIICGRGGKFEKFRPAGDTAPDRGAVSFSLRKREESAIVLDFQTKVLNLATVEGATAGAPVVTEDGVTGSGGDPGVEVDSYKQLYREYIRFLLSGVEPRAPAWFEEGVAQIFMAMDVTRTEIVVGKLEDPNTISTEQAAINEAGTGGAAPAQDRDFNAALARRGLLPMGELLAVKHDDPQALNPVGGTWAKQAYAFVHWGLYGDEGRHQKAFVSFIARLDREPLSEALFKECFKKSYKDMGVALRGYIEMTSYRIAGVRAGKGEKLPDAPPFELREATESEVGRITGDTLRLAGHTAAARTAMIAPYIRGERDPALLAAIGLLEHDGGDPVRARKFLEGAAKAKAPRPRAHLALARLRFAEAEAAGVGATPAPGEKIRFSTDQTVNVLTPLFTARSLPPPLPEVYELIAETWARSLVTPAPEHLVVLEEGVRYFPRNAALVHATAVQKVRIGLVADAHALIALGLRVAPTPEFRAKFETLKAALPPAPPAPVPATKAKKS